MTSTDGLFIIFGLIIAMNIWAINHINQTIREEQEKRQQLQKLTRDLAIEVQKLLRISLDVIR